MTLTDKQKKIAWIIGGILLFIHFAPGIWNSARQAWASRRQDVTAQKPSPIHFAPAVPQHVALPPPPPSPDAKFLALAGVWTGTAVMPNSDFCEVKLELSANQDTPVLYTGYSTMSCSPVLPMAGHTYTSKTLPPTLIPKLAPVSTVLSGPVENSAIHLRLQQSVNKFPSGCEPTSFSLTPFGAAQLATRWEEGQCQGGNLLMRRSTR